MCLLCEVELILLFDLENLLKNRDTAEGAVPEVAETSLSFTDESRVISERGGRGVWKDVGVELEEAEVGEVTEIGALVDDGKGWTFPNEEDEAISKLPRGEAVTDPGALLEAGEELRSPSSFRGIVGFVV